MARLYLHSSSPPRRAALAELLANVPDMMLVSTPEEADAVVCDGEPEPSFPRHLPCLMIGAAPQRWSHLVKRLESLLAAAEDGGDFAIGAYLCAPLERCLYDDMGQEKARLTEKEVRLLQVLADAGAAGVGRSDLLHKVWGYGADLETHTLETHVYRLRQKLEDNPDQPRLLLTLEGGYALATGEGESV